MKYKHLLSFVVLFIAYLFVGQLLFWEFHSYDVLTFNKPPLRIVTPQLHRGDRLFWEVDVTHKTNGIKVTVVRELQDGYILNFPDVSYVTKIGRQAFTNSLIIPANVAPGNYRLSVDSIFHVNPIRDVTVSVVSEPFEILK